jgi:broad specificity phosphatase PhoE
LHWPGGESRRGFATRILTTFLGIIERHERHSVAVVCHGGVIGAFCAQLGVGPQDDALRWAVANCSVTHVVVTPEHTRLELWNDITHLDEVQTGPFGVNSPLVETD